MWLWWFSLQESIEPNQFEQDDAYPARLIVSHTELLENGTDLISNRIDGCQSNLYVNSYVVQYRWLDWCILTVTIFLFYVYFSLLFEAAPIGFKGRPASRQATGRIRLAWWIRLPIKCNVHTKETVLVLVLYALKIISTASAAIRAPSFMKAQTMMNYNFNCLLILEYHQVGV